MEATATAERTIERTVPKGAYLVPPPDVGVHRNTHESVYRSWDAINQSLLKVVLEQSPKHAQHERRFPSPPGPAMKLGSAVHAFLIEPEKFDERVAIEPELDARTKVGKALRAEFERASAGKIIITPAQREKVDRIAEAILATGTGRDLVGWKTECETALVWDETVRLGDAPPVTVRCKGRIDWFVPGLGGVDLKTTGGIADGEEFLREVFNRKYFFQDAFYERGWQRLHGGQREDWTIIAAETEPPYGVAFHTLHGDWLSMGNTLIEEAIRKWGRCQASGRWTGYPDSIQDALPLPWMTARFTDGNH